MGRYNCRFCCFWGEWGSKSKVMTSAFVTVLVVFVFQKQLEIATHSNSPTL